MPRVAAATDRQLEVLEPLIVFKGLHDEDMAAFSIRLRDVFDNIVTHRVRTNIDVPVVPQGKLPYNMQRYTDI